MPHREAYKNATAVTLEQMLNAREHRAFFQQQLLEQFRLPLVSFTMNIPGEFKTYPLALRAFREGDSLIRRQLERGGVPVTQHWASDARTGSEGYYVVEGDARWVKRLLVELEDSHPLGRIFDIDVLDADGTALRGKDHGRGERTCLICGGPVWQCARSRAHSAEELAQRTAAIIGDYFDDQCADRIAGLAVRALLYEVSATPKPGLVDRGNNGAHRDMDIFTFVDSSCALLPYFFDVARAARRFRGEPEALLDTLRFVGQQAEDRMFAATGGINTHKGLIFSLGLVCAAAGYLDGGGPHAGGKRPRSPEALLTLCGRIAQGVPAELAISPAPGAGTDGTQGERAFRQYGLTGARGEAAAGFPGAGEWGYPTLRYWRARGGSLNDAGVAALLRMLCKVNDTNIIGRADLETLREMQRRLEDFFVQEPDLEAILAHARELDGEFIRRNLSPGGCADLLAISYMLYFLFDE